MTEKTLVLIKPDAMAKQLAGQIISELYKTELKMIGLKLVETTKDLIETHYEEHKNSEHFEKLIKHLTGEYHNQPTVIAIVYEGENAIKKIRDIAGKTNPNHSAPNTIRGKYGRIHTDTDVFENVIHASDSDESAKREIKLWFEENELII
jgi:nucleoside-diphosphate kinase